MYEIVLFMLFTSFASAKGKSEEVIIVVISASATVSVVSIVVTIVICCQRRCCCKNSEQNFNTTPEPTHDELLRQNLIPPLFFTQNLPDPLEQDDLLDKI